MADHALNLDAARSALLLMDFQPGIVSRHGGDDAPVLAHAVRLRDAARGAGVPVIFVTVGFRPGYPEVSPRNRMFAPVREAGGFRADSSDTSVHPKLARKEDEVHIIKRRVGAFSGTELDLVLRAGGIDTLVMAGIATSGVVLSTLRVAADLDYRCVVVADACADADTEVHDCLTGKVFARQADVVATTAVEAAL